MTTEHRYRKSFIGGLLGGSLGFLSGALVHSSVVSVVLFFVLGYVGYDLKGTAAIFGVTLKAACKAFVYVFGKCLELIRCTAPWSLTALAVTLFLMPYIILIGLSQSHESTDALAVTGDVFRWVFTGHTRILSSLDFSTDTVWIIRVLWGFLLIMVCFAVALVVAAFLTGMAHLILSVLYEGFVEGFVRPFVQWVQGVSEWPRTIVWLLCYLVLWPLLVVPWVAASTLCLMYKVERLVTGAATLLAGTVFLFMMPFGLMGSALAAASIGCGFACGLASIAAMRLAAVTPIRARIEAFARRTFGSFVPLRDPAWMAKGRAT